MGAQSSYAHACDVSGSHSKKTREKTLLTKVGVLHLNQPVNLTQNRLESTHCSPARAIASKVRYPINCSCLLRVCVSLRACPLRRATAFNDKKSCWAIDTQKTRAEASSVFYHPPLLSISQKEKKRKNNLTDNNCSARVAAPLDKRLHLLDTPVVSRGVGRVNEAHQSRRTVRGWRRLEPCRPHRTQKAAGQTAVL